MPPPATPRCRARGATHSCGDGHTTTPETPGRTAPQEVWRTGWCPATGLNVFRPKYSPTTAQLVGALASQMANRHTNARSKPRPLVGRGQQGKGDRAGQEAHISTDVWRSGPRPSRAPDTGAPSRTIADQTGRLRSARTRPCSPWMGTICTVTPASDIRRNAVPTVRCISSPSWRARRVRADRSLPFGLQLFVTVPLYLVLGWAADRFSKPSVLMWASLPARSPLPCWASPTRAAACSWRSCACLPSATPARRPNWAVVWRVFWGGRHSVGCRATIQFANFPGVLCAPVFLGWWYDHHHSYALPLWLYTGVRWWGH